MLAEETADFFKAHVIPRGVALFVFKKYPEVWNGMSNDYYAHVEPAFKIMRKIMRSALDDRNDRSILEWEPIIHTAIEESVGDARRKYYGTTADGKKVYLSTKQIKHKIPEVIEFGLGHYEHMPYYVAFQMKMFEFCLFDPEINKICMDLGQKIDQLTKESLLQSWALKSKQDEKPNNNGAAHSNNNSDIKYRYFEFRHTSKELYEEQKLKCKNGTRKANPDGLKYCCIRKPEELSSPAKKELL